METEINRNRNGRHEMMMTPEEKHLWIDFLRSYPVRFRRQQKIGNCIANFYCDRAKLAIALDDSPHCEAEGKGDAAGAESLESIGIEWLRFSSFDINHCFESVCLSIEEKVDARIPSRQTAASL